MTTVIVTSGVSAMTGMTAGAGTEVIEIVAGGMAMTMVGATDADTAVMMTKLGVNH